MLIDDFLAKTKIASLYHFTDMENLPLIRQHGLLSFSELQRRGIVPPKPGGNDWSRDADARCGIDRFVHLCLKDQHPMEFQARAAGHIGKTRFLRISCEVLRYEGVFGSAAVANKTGVAVLSLEAALDQIDFQILFGGRIDFADPDLRNRYNEAKKSEILVPTRIPQELIFNLD